MFRQNASIAYIGGCLLHLHFFFYIYWLLIKINNINICIRKRRDKIFTSTFKCKMSEKSEISGLILWIIRIIIFIATLLLSNIKDECFDKIKVYHMLVAVYYIYFILLVKKKEYQYLYSHAAGK